MLKLIKQSAVVVGFFGLVVGCGSSTPPPSQAATTPAATALTLNTPVETIVANPAGKAVLDKDFPGMTSNSNYGFIKFMSLKALQPLSGGEMTDAQLRQAQTDLAAVPPTP